MDSYIELTNFHKKIVEYEELIKKQLKSKYHTTHIIEIRELEAELQRDFARLDEIIEHYGGYGLKPDNPLLDKIFGKKTLMSSIAFGALNPINYTGKLRALNDIKGILNKAIGKLEAEGESWPETPSKLKRKTTKPKVFISHSGSTPALLELREYLDDLDIEKLLVMKKPNLDRTINEKVEAYLDEANFVIILATGDSTDRGGNVIPAGNVLHEIGLSQAKSKFKGKIIYLLEEGARFPSNIRPKGYIRFNRANISHVFGEITKEIKGMGFSI